MFHLLKDKNFLKEMVILTIPIALQNLITSSLNMVDAIMVGELGETAIAGVGIANQVFFLLNLIIFGICSGASIFAAQYWGRQDIAGVRTVLGISLVLGCSVSAVFMTVSLLFPHRVIGIFTPDRAVIALGSQFLALNAFGYVMMSVTFCYSFMSRSTGNARLPMLTSAVALSLNTLLNFLLIRGRFGFPSMGVRGAGLATLISRAVEVTVILLAVYMGRHPIAAGLRELLSFTGEFIKKFMLTTFPVIIHEGLWSLAVTFYIYIYAHMGTDVVAAMNISSNIERLSMVLFMGMGNACAIMIGHRIGEQRTDQAYRDAGKLLLLGPLLGIFTGVLLMASSKGILLWFNVSDAVRYSASQVLFVVSLMMPLRICNLILIVGIIRSGGDTMFGLLMEIIPMWLVAIPLTYVSGLYWHLPIIVVYLMVTTEEFIKFGIGIWRFYSKKWINLVVAHPE